MNENIKRFLKIIENFHNGFVDQNDESIEDTSEERLKDLLQAGIDVNATNQQGESLLYWALKNNYLEIAEQLIDAGAEIHIQNEDGTTPLHWALEHFNYSHTLIEKLIAKGANVKAADINGRTPLHMPYNSLATTLLLLNAGANANAQDNDGNTPLHLQMTKYKPNTALMFLLLEHGANIYTLNHDMKTPLSILGSQGELGTLIQRIFKGGRFDDLCKTLGEDWRSVQTPQEMVNKIMEYYPGIGLYNIFDTSDINRIRNTQKFFQIAEEHNIYAEEMLKQLIEAGIDFNAKNEHGYTPLMSAAAYYPEIAKQLIHLGADVKVKDNRGRTPLHHATGTCLRDHKTYELIELLLKNKADVNAKDNYNETPIRDAVSYGSLRLEVTRLLLDSGADVNTPGLLTQAVSIDSPEIVLFLLRKGAQMDDSVPFVGPYHCRAEVLLAIINKIADAGRFEELREALGADLASVQTPQQMVEEIKKMNLRYKPEKCKTINKTLVTQYRNAMLMAPPSLVSRLLDILETDAPDVQEEMSVVDDVNSDLQADVLTLQEEVDMADEFKSSLRIG